ncbi:hypothetical protein V8F20_012617 [Naviculisporaceae sp. PSN 640]
MDAAIQQAPAGEDMGSTIIGVTVLFWVIALVALCMRFWSLRIRKRGFFAHDALILIAFFFGTALAVCLIVSVQTAGMGKHSAELILAGEPWRLITFAKLLIGWQILWCLSVTAVRLSMVHLYLYLFSTKKTFQIACYIMLAICYAWAVAEVLVVFLFCRPIEANWDPAAAATGSCGNLEAAYISVHAANFAVDLSIALLPTFVLWELKMRTAKKVGIMLMFALGILICSIAVARIALYKLILAYDQSDFTYAGSTMFVFTAMEPLLGCALACMPMLQPVAEAATGSVVMSWVKSLITKTKTKSSSQGGTSTSITGSGKPVRNGYWRAGSSQEGLHPGVGEHHVSIGSFYGARTGSRKGDDSDVTMTSTFEMTVEPYRPGR